ncbi:DUF4249 domain-containing protein [Muricauda sp. CAU 1633]|uniref:DUF4249 domain-containing protein n=1 Tax=Allomuricauda sp. CAU 1633 TaxID=2816036 RepID=UPI001A8E916F|nr:DUF4249 domain-containing protein [Muricauda sp. CAU 1633]MBO0322348.1 DUF4249 domain-containing protein [Muricauda sp. CAU 1633]
MKPFYIVYICILFVAVSCTDVIEVDVPEAPPRLTVEASLDWEQGTAGNNQIIRLSTSTPFFAEQKISPVLGASVQVTNVDSGAEFIFEDQNNGQYTTSSFVPVIGNTYQLEIIYNGERYTATETLIPVSEIVDVFQSTKDGEDEDALEVNVTFQDPADTINYYFLRFQSDVDLLPELYYIKDEFIDGNEFTIYYEKIEDEDDGIGEFQPGEMVDIAFYGISEQYHDYLRLLVEQYENSGTPFSPTPVPLVGNCINTDNPENIAYGYFRVTEAIKTTYTIQ